MTYDEYWYGDVWRVVAYREAERRRKERKNWELHLQGMYFYEALCDVSPILHAFAKSGTKPHPYRTEPYKLYGSETEEETEDQKNKKEEADRIKAKLYMQNMVRAGKNWGK
jgi:hypothetical protein